MCVHTPICTLDSYTSYTADPCDDCPSDTFCDFDPSVVTSVASCIPNECNMHNGGCSYTEECFHFHYDGCPIADCHPEVICVSHGMFNLFPINLAFD